MVGTKGGGWGDDDGRVGGRRQVSIRAFPQEEIGNDLDMLQKLSRHKRDQATKKLN